jgi:RNA polymerase sigma factor (sigma-70 family)
VPIPLKKNWTLTREAFDKLLVSLDPDSERAAEKYENIRRKLITFFESRGCLYPEDYADEAMNRVARRIIEGLELRQTGPASYFYGVAQHLLQEYWEEPAKNYKSLDDISPAKYTSEDPDRLRAGEAEKIEYEQQIECLEGCMEKLPADKRELIINYYQGETGAKIENRKRIAQNLDIPLNALRIRALRIREKLELCLDDCLGGQRGA